MWVGFDFGAVRPDEVLWPGAEDQDVVVSVAQLIGEPEPINDGAWADAVHVRQELRPVPESKGRAG